MSTPEPESSLYDRDSYTWAKRQAAALKRRDVEAIDWENVSEEIEALAREDERALRDGYSTIIQNFLKLQYSEGWQWDDSVEKVRSEIASLLEDSPGLEAERRRLYRSAWRWARRQVIVDFVNQATAAVVDEDSWSQEQERLTQEWSELIPQKNPYTRRQIEEDFWRPARIHLTDRPG